MQLTLTTLSDLLYNIDISEDLELENFKVLCEMETGVPAHEMAIVWNGRPLHDDKRTLKQYGLKNGEMVLIHHLHGLGNFGHSHTHQEDDPVSMRDHFLKNPSHMAMLKERNPPLADALLSGDLEKFRKVFNEQRQSRLQHEQDRMKLFIADPYDPGAQHLIEEAIRLRNVESNMASAIEFVPEIFAQVHMLYIDCKVNGCPVKAFVDTGAQMTVMSQECAERCNIMRLVDKRWSGVAQGVGTQKIIGRVHLCQIQIGNAFFQSSFCILESEPLDMLLGLDMLKRHECVIDFKKNHLQIGSSGTVAPFLGEAELTEWEKTGKMPTSKPSTSKAPQSAPAHLQYPEEIVERLMSYGFSRHVVLEELRHCNGNADHALASLLSKSFSSKH